MLQLGQNQGFSQSVKNNYTDVFLKYKKEYKKIYVYIVHGFIPNKLYRVLGVKNTKWDIIDIYPGKTYMGQDSLVKKKCSNCFEVDSIIQANGIINLKTEQELSSQCIKKRDSNEIYTRPPKSLDEVSDIDYRMVEFNLNGCDKKIVYRNPFEALEICPESIERKKFANIINAILFAR
jgi:hypothetical protein